LFDISSVADFANPEARERLLQTFLARAQIAEGVSGGVGTSGASTALTLLSQANRPSLFPAI